MKKRILIVEDDAALSRVLRDNLAFDCFEVQCVANGDLAIAAAREFAPDLILLDIVLPGKNGFELFSALSQAGRTPIIVLSARAKRDDKLRGLKIGADDYVTKPFDLEELLARVRCSAACPSDGRGSRLRPNQSGLSGAPGVEGTPRSAPLAPGIRRAAIPGRASRPHCLPE